MDGDIYFGYSFDAIVMDEAKDFCDYDMVVADLMRPMKSMAELADAMTTAAVAIAECDWGVAVSTLVDGLNAIVQEAREPQMPRKAKLERRQIWLKRSETQCRQRIAQSRNRLQMQDRKRSQKHWSLLPRGR